jgi:hypothetical protein
MRAWLGAAVIPAERGYTAIYRPEGDQYHLEREVVAWEDDGSPLVLSETDGKGLVPAASYPGLDCIEKRSPLVAFLNGGGWRCDDRPVVVWGIRANDAVEPGVLLPRGGIRFTPGLTAFLSHPLDWQK